jgi:hypothetical protein
VPAVAAGSADDAEDAPVLTVPATVPINSPSAPLIATLISKTISAPFLFYFFRQTCS